jgi:hypothetical protein
VQGAAGVDRRLGARVVPLPSAHHSKRWPTRFAATYGDANLALSPEQEAEWWLLSCYSASVEEPECEVVWDLHRLDQ